MYDIKIIQNSAMLNLSIFKIFFPATSVLIFFLIFFSIRGVPEAEYLNKSIPIVNEFNSVVIKNGEIFGLTQEKDSFYFTSSNILYANLPNISEYNLVLEKLVGQIEYSQEDILFAKSPKAKYFVNEKKIQSIKNTFYNRDESVLGKSIHLEINLKTGSVESNGPSLISGSNFFITSKYLNVIDPEYETDDNKMVLQFNDGVHASFTPNR